MKRRLTTSYEELGESDEPVIAPTLSIQVSFDPGLRQSPLVSHGSHRNPDHVRRFGFVEPSEVSKFEDPSGAWIDPSKFFQQVDEGHEFGRGVSRSAWNVSERDPLPIPSSFCGLSLANVIDEDLLDGQGGDGHEPGLIDVEVGIRVGQLEIGLVNELGRLKGQAGIATTSEAGRRHLSQLLVDVSIQIGHRPRDPGLGLGQVPSDAHGVRKA